MSSAKSLLIVDDDSSVHELIQAMLRSTAWELTCAESGAEALEHLRKRDFSVILTDILMPELDGLSLINRIREIRPEANVLVMTAYNRPAHVVGSMRGLASGYLTKPFNKDTLSEALEDALEYQMAPDDIEIISDRPNWITVRVRCKLSIANRLVQFFRELPADLEADDRELAATAFRELLINAIEHGGHLDPELKVELAFIRTELSIVYYVRDPGPGFSMENLPHAAISHPDDPTEHAQVRAKMGIRPGGFGLLLLKNFADELIYNSKGNEVLFIKRL